MAAESGGCLVPAWGGDYQVSEIDHQRIVLIFGSFVSFPWRIAIGKKTNGGDLVLLL
jgi:hypothetical protein